MLHKLVQMLIVFFFLYDKRKSLRKFVSILRRNKNASAIGTNLKSKYHMQVFQKQTSCYVPLRLNEQLCLSETSKLTKGHWTSRPLVFTSLEVPRNWAQEAHHLGPAVLFGPGKGSFASAPKPKCPKSKKHQFEFQYLCESPRPTT